MNRIIRSALIFCLLVFAFCLSPVYAEGANTPESIMDMIPNKALAYVSISNLDAVVNSVVESPEWQELLDIEEIAEDLDKAKQALSFGPMLLGISIEEFLNSFGHNMAMCLMGMEGQMPIAGLIVDTGDYREEVEYAVEQAATFPAIAGGAMVEEKEYRDVACTVVGSKTFQVRYGFLDGFLVAGVGGGFEELVDFYKDGGKSIKETPNFQFMEQKVSLSSNICVYADLERAMPTVKHIAGISPEGASEEEFNVMMANLASDSAKALALSLSLSDHTNELYLYLKPKDQHPITDLVLAPHSPMTTADLVPLANGVMVGINLGDPTELLDRGIKLVGFLGQDVRQIEDQIKGLEKGLGLDLREDFLSTLTGEITIMAMLPNGQIDLEKEDKMKLAMQAAKTRLVAIIGVKDQKRLEKTAEKLSKLANLETVSLKGKSHSGTKINTKIVPMNALIPGLAFMPSYAFKNDLLIMSNNAESIQDAVDLLDSAGDTEIQKELSESRALVYLDAGGIGSFIAEQGLLDETRLPEAAQGKMSSLGSIAASFALGSDGAGIKLVSTSDDNWGTKILRGVLIGVYANVYAEKEKEQETGELEQPEPEEESGDVY